MSATQEYAYITGGAGGLGKAVAEKLVARGIKVFIADRDILGAQDTAKELGAETAAVDVADWDSQKTAFKQAVEKFGRIDYVLPIAGVGENRWTPTAAETLSSDEFGKPNLAVIDINVSGMLYTVSLAVQQFRRQSLNAHGFRGKVIIAGSFCGIYCCPSLPIYTTSKHAVTGLVRSWGAALPAEKITLNSVNPNVMRTSFSTDHFYDALESEGLLTPIEGAVEAFVQLLGSNPASGQCFEVGPEYDDGQGIYHSEFPHIPDSKQQAVFDKLAARGEAR